MALPRRLHEAHPGLLAPAAHAGPYPGRLVDRRRALAAPAAVRSKAPGCRPGRWRCWAMLGIALEVRGQPPVTGPVLLVANHISWLDIPVMHAARHCRFVSKSDVQGLAAGRHAGHGGGHAVHRAQSRRDALRMVHLMRRRAAGERGAGGVPRRHHRRWHAAAAFSCQLAAGRRVGRCAGPAGRPALCRPGQRPDQPCAQLHRRRNPARLDLAHPLRAAASWPWCITANPNGPRAATAAPGARICATRWTACAKADAGFLVRPVTPRF